MKPVVDVHLYDTTLRDGTQREGPSLTCDDKLRIARRLDRIGVSFIEGGWPGSNPKDAEFFQRTGELALEHAQLTAFGATRRAGIAASDDPQLAALLESGARVCTVFGKTSPLQVKSVLRVSPEENLKMIEDTVALLSGHGRRAFYDAEHFFDGYAADPSYALEALDAAARGGAEAL